MASVYRNIPDCPSLTRDTICRLLSNSDVDKKYLVLLSIYYNNSLQDAQIPLGFSSSTIKKILVKYKKKHLLIT